MMTMIVIVLSLLSFIGALCFELWLSWVEAKAEQKRREKNLRMLYFETRDNFGKRGDHR